jgi:hypothetical protein
MSNVTETQSKKRDTKTAPNTDRRLDLLDYAGEMRSRVRRELERALIRVSALLAWAEVEETDSGDTSGETTELRRIARNIRQAGRLLGCETTNLEELRARLLEHDEASAFEDPSVQ